MNNEIIFNIPEKIKVGLRTRRDTYTGKLAYVTYLNEKVEIAKFNSWDGWRDRKINPLEFENKPTEGFVLNKKVGGERSGWNHRNTYARVYDPRGFEFEITIENLLFILEECVSNKGKGLEGKFVYSWVGKDLILLPESSMEYKRSIDYKNSKQNIKFSQLVRGDFYKTEVSNNPLCYLGYFRWRRFVGTVGYGYVSQEKKIHTFFDVQSNRAYGIVNSKHIINHDSSEPLNDAETEDIIEKFKRSYSGDESKIAEITCKKADYKIIYDERKEIYSVYFNAMKQLDNDRLLFFELMVHPSKDMMAYMEYCSENNVQMSLNEFYSISDKKDSFSAVEKEYILKKEDQSIKLKYIGDSYFSDNKSLKADFKNAFGNDIADFILENIGLYTYKFCGISENGNEFEINTFYKFNDNLFQDL